MPLSHHEVLEYYTDLKQHYSSRDRKMTEEDRVFEQEFAGLVDVPYEVRIFKSSTARNIVEGFRNQIRTNEPTVDFKAVGPSVQAAKHSTLMQKWGYSMLRKERLFGTTDPTSQNAFDLLLRGASCKRITVDVDRMLEPPPKRGTRAYDEWIREAMATWGYISRAIDPMSCFPPPGQRKPFTFFIERQVRYAQEIKDIYPDWIDVKKGKPSRAIEFLQYWADDQYMALADGSPALEKANPYALQPYIYEWSGMGRSHADNDPVHLASGILTGILGELEEEVRLKTAISVQTQMHVFPPILTIEDPKKVAKQFGVGPGKVIKYMPGHPPEYMKYPPPNENMYLFLDTIKENINRVFSASLSGSPDPGVRFGVLNAQNIGQALTAIAPIRATLDRIGTQTLNMMAAMASHMDLHMAVEGGLEPVEAPMRVEGSDFSHLNFVVTFEAVDPSENDRALLVGESLRRAGDISRRTFWKKYAKHIIEDPDEEEILLLEEKLFDLLVASGQLGQAVLSEDVQAQFAEQAAQAVANVKGSLGADTGTDEGTSRVSELNSLGGPNGVAPETAQAGFNAAQSNTGLVRR